MTVTRRGQDPSNDAIGLIKLIPYGLRAASLNGRKMLPFEDLPPTQDSGFVNPKPKPTHFATSQAGSLGGW